MDNVDVFNYDSIEEDEHNKILQEAPNTMKGNIIPKGVVSMEKPYDLHNWFRGPINTKT